MKESSSSQNLKIIKFFLMLAIGWTSNSFYAQDLFINEFMASNVTSVPEIVDYDDYPDWVEIYNASNSSIDLGGYFITDDLNNPTKWQVPDGALIRSKGFLIFFADGNDDYPHNDIKYYHMPFGLSKVGEEIGLYSPEQVLIDSIIYNSQITDISFGRKPDGGSNWFYFGEPTPEKNNSTQGVVDTIKSNPPTISLDAGFYSGTQLVNINSDQTDAVITFTTDGALPQSDSPIYSLPLEINNNTTLRARVFEDGKLPSKIVTKSYFINEQQNLPTLSITVFPETFFDNEIGIYTNKIKSREVPVNVQYFEDDGSLAFEVDGGARLTGQASFEYPQKPLTIELDDKYGYESIKYPIFKDRPFKSYTSIYLRNSGTDDNLHTHFRDAYQHSLVINQMDIDCQAFQPAATFINGEYWGIYNLREKLDNNYLVAHHNVNPDNVDYLEYEFSPEPNIIEGNTDEYYAFQDFLAANSMNIPENWEYVKSQLDINEVMNYLITEFYCDNINWPYTNSRWWKEKSEQGKWRYIFLDSDFGFGSPGWFSHYTNNSLAYLYDASPFNNYPFSTFVFRKLLLNKDFKDEFIQRFATYLNTTFRKERIVGILDSIKTMLNDEMVNHIDRWNEESPNIPNVAAWNYEVDVMREFAENRTDYMKQHILDFYNLSGIEKLQFTTSEPDGGIIKVTGINVPNNYSGDYFRYVPLRIQAFPSVGYKFVKWEGVPDSLSQNTYFIPIRSDSTIKITAVFEEENVFILPSVILENTILDIAQSPYYAKGDIVINPGVNLTFEPGVEILMPEGARFIVNGTLRMLGTEEQPIKIKPNIYSGFNNWGIIYLENSTGENVFEHVELIGSTSGSDLPNQIGAISGYKSDIKINNITIMDAPFPIFTQYGNVVIQNSTLHSEETCDLINIKYAESALVENCDLRGNNSFDTDAIDYDQISSGMIRNNKIYNFYGSNSDGIDLGEGSKDILIENNLILNCSDKGISVGQASTTNIKNNIIVNCAQGVGVKDYQSFAFIDRNTFSHCDLGVASFEKNIGAGGGNAEIVNSIFYQSVTNAVFVDDLSSLTVSYSLSNTKNLDGLENIKAEPNFANNYFLYSNSQAINSGNPSTELDPDGTRADIGAKYFNNQFQPIIINEINYNPAEGENMEFVELYNSMSDPIDISGYKLVGAINFTFPPGITLGGKGFVLLVKEIPQSSDTTVHRFVWDGPSLPNNWGNLKLFNSLGEEVDFVSYSNKFDWPTAADGKGYSLELKNPLEENLETINWKASDSQGGSPGKANRINLSTQIFINEFQTDNQSTVKDEFDEYDDWIELYNAGNTKVNLGGLYITDDFSNLTKFQIPSTNDGSNILNPKDHLIFWADNSIDQGSNHLNFRLDANGEEIALVYIFENDTTILDSISFGKQEMNFSLARISDGASSWKIVKAPTPGEKNSNSGLFEKGILLVNGLRFNISEVFTAYQNEAFWGTYNISFWDLFSEPSTGYPESLPQPLLPHGAVPLDTLLNYSTVVWTGENISNEVGFWNSTQALDYVKWGGNLILLLKNGRDYFSEPMLDRLGISWAEPDNAIINNCISVADSLSSISILQTQYLSSIFDTAFTNENSKLLYIENSNDEPRGIGMWNKPEYGGWYKENGGQTVFLSGRAYRYNNEDLRKNIEYIFKNFFGEPKTVISVDRDDKIINEFVLSQNYPNPFNPSTTIQYSIPHSTVILSAAKNLKDFSSSSPNVNGIPQNDNENVMLKVFDVLGREVEILVNQIQKPGRYNVSFNAKNYASGMYFYRLEIGDNIAVRKMILLK